MAFLGFQISIKDRMIKSNGFVPDNMPPNHYNNILKNIMDDNKWDNQVFDAITMKKPAQIFLISDDIITEYRYLKKIRNDCVHAKHNEITNSHVEIIWSFIEANYYRIVLNGGKASLLDKVERHFDIRYTAPNTSWNSIVEIITSVIEVSELKSFFSDVYKIFEEKYPNRNVFKVEKCNEFWNEIYQSGDGILKEEFIKFLKDDKDLFLGFLLEFPEHLYDFYVDTEFMRIFWNDWLWNILKIRPNIFIKLAYQLIEQAIIPIDERVRFIKKIVCKSSNIYERSDYPLLYDYEYGDYLKLFLFNEKNYEAPNGINYANNHWGRIKKYITLIDLDVDIVKLLNSLYTITSFGDFHEGMTDLFHKNNDFTEKYKKIIIENHLKLPDCLNEEQDQEE